jgi:hypothetical protein
MYIYAYKYIHMCTYICIHTHTHIYAYTYIHAYIRMILPQAVPGVCLCVCMYVCTYVYACLCMYVCMYVPHLDVCKYVCMSVRMYVYVHHAEKTISKAPLSAHKHSKDHCHNSVYACNIYRSKSYTCMYLHISLAHHSHDCTDKITNAQTTHVYKLPKPHMYTNYPNHTCIQNYPNHTCMQMSCVSFSPQEVAQRSRSSAPPSNVWKHTPDCYLFSY